MKSIGILKTVYNQCHLVDRIVNNINDYGSHAIQTFIQDDCSKDNTYEEYVQRHPKFSRIWKTKQNSGVRANISSLLDKCDTDYLTFSAGDDFIYPPTIRLLLQKIQEDDSDIVVAKCVHVSDEHAYSLTLKSGNDFPFRSLPQKNERIFSTKWTSSQHLLAAAATNPGLLWSQGILVKTSLAKRAGFPTTGNVDDWGFQHNLAVIGLSENLKITLINEILGVLTIQPSSMGSEVERQLKRQVHAIHHHWDPRLKKAALLNGLTKKLDQFRATRFSYDDICNVFLEALSQTQSVSSDERRPMP